LTLAEIERDQIQRVLQECGHNKSLAARRLGLHRSTLYAKLRELPVGA
jgi:ActR/RegA family two-component response regulator